MTVFEITAAPDIDDRPLTRFDLRGGQSSGFYSKPKPGSAKAKKLAKSRARHKAARKQNLQRRKRR